MAMQGLKGGACLFIARYSPMATCASSSKSSGIISCRETCGGLKDNGLSRRGIARVSTCSRLGADPLADRGGERKEVNRHVILGE